MTLQGNGSAPPSHHLQLLSLWVYNCPRFTGNCCRLACWNWLLFPGSARLPRDIPGIGHYLQLRLMLRPGCQVCQMGMQRTYHPDSQHFEAGIFFLPL